MPSWCPQTSSLTLPPPQWAAWLRPGSSQPNSYSPLQSCLLYFPSSLLTVLQQKVLWLLSYLPLPLNVFTGSLCFEWYLYTSMCFQPVFAFASLCVSWPSGILWLHPILMVFLYLFSSYPSLFLERCSPNKLSSVTSTQLPYFHTLLLTFPQEPVIFLLIFCFVYGKNCFTRNVLLPG